MPTTTTTNFDSSQMLPNSQLINNNSIATTSSFNSPTTTVPSSNFSSSFSTINLLMKDAPAINSNNNSRTSCSDDSVVNSDVSTQESKGLSTSKDILNVMQKGLFPTHLLPHGFFGLPGLFNANNMSNTKNKVESPIDPKFNENFVANGNLPESKILSDSSVQIKSVETINNDFSKDLKKEK